MNGTTVTAQETTPADGAEPQTVQIEDNYVIITDGTAHVAGVQLHRLEDGTHTHVITVKGIKP